MREREPIVVPAYGHQPREDNWYCLLCDNWRANAGDVRSHLRATHDVREGLAERGIHYDDGAGILDLIDKRAAWVLRQEQLFHLSVESLLGADDFALEVGDGAPVPKGEWRKADA